MSFFCCAGLRSQPVNRQESLGQQDVEVSNFPLSSLKLTAKAPENGWLEYDCFLLGVCLFFRGKLAVSFRECIFHKKIFF